MLNIVKIRMIMIKIKQLNIFVFVIRINGVQYATARLTLLNSTLLKNILKNLLKNYEVIIYNIIYINECMDAALLCSNGQLFQPFLVLCQPI